MTTADQGGMGVHAPRSLGCGAVYESGLRVLVPFTRPVVYGRLVRRRKRFLVDVVLDGSARAVEVTAHTANTGAMTGLVDEGARVMLTDHEGTKRALRYELEAVEADRGDGTRAFVSVNTISANAFAARAVELGLVDELAGYPIVRREVAPSARSRSRLDLVLEHDTALTGRRCFVEVKSVTLKDERRALFPDAVTERGKKHLDALARLAKKGERAAMLYVNKRPGCDVFRPAAAIDRAYANALRRAARAGVEVLCIDCVVDERGLSYGGRLTVDLT